MIVQRPEVEEIHVPVEAHKRVRVCGAEAMADAFECFSGAVATGYSPDGRGRTTASRR